MKYDLDKIALAISADDAEKLDKSFEKFSEGAEITDDERERILSSVMRKAGFDMKNIDNINNTNNSTTAQKPGKGKLIAVKFAAAMAAAAVLIGSVPLMVSADVGPAYDIMYMISPEIAQSLKPVNKSCEKNGIELNVISADIEGSTATVYVSVTDKVGGQLDDTVDLFDSYRINTSFDAACGCVKDRYDPETNTAYFMLTISEMNGKDIEYLKKKKITFSVNTLLSNKQTFEGVIDEIDLSKAENNCETISIPSSRTYGGSTAGIDADNSPEFFENLRCLIPNETPLASPVDGIDITAVGYADNMLHVQAYYENTMEYDNHGFITLLDKNGNTVDESYSKLYMSETNESDSYNESYFDIPYEEIGDYSVYGEFVTCGTRIDGDWEVTFRLDQ